PGPLPVRGAGGRGGGGGAGLRQAAARGGALAAAAGGGRCRRAARRGGHDVPGALLGRRRQPCAGGAAGRHRVVPVGRDVAGRGLGPHAARGRGDRRLDGPRRADAVGSPRARHGYAAVPSRHHHPGPAMSAEPGRTAERVCVDHATSSADERRIYLFHLATYDFARRYVRGGRVLDFGCGTGYGDARIASDCAAVTGVDVSSAAIEHARRTYVADNLDYRVIAPVDQAPLPFADGSFDAVLSFQVIEHVPDPDRYVAEAWRVLDHGGVLIVATPDRRVRLLPGQR